MTHTVKISRPAGPVPIYYGIYAIHPLPFVHHVPRDRARLELLMVCTSGDYLRARDGAQLTGTGESQGRDLARALKLGECRGEQHIASRDCITGVSRVPLAHGPCVLK